MAAQAGDLLAIVGSVVGVIGLVVLGITVLLTGGHITITRKSEGRRRG
jgi:hypothetical protein